MQMLRRVEDQGRIENSEAERREDLNEEQRGRSLRSRGEKAFERFDEADTHHLRSLPRELDRLCRLILVGSIHHALLCRSTRRVMSSRACDVSLVDPTTNVRGSRPRFRLANSGNLLQPGKSVPPLPITTQ